VVDEAVDHGGGGDVVTEDFTPTAERLIGGDDETGPFLARGHQLEVQVGRFGLERAVTDLVDDEERVAGQADESGLQGCRRDAPRRAGRPIG
jgi:hypothetical protein